MAIEKKMTYAAAGVDIEAGDLAVKKIRELARGTFTPAVLSEIGSFGAFYKPDVSGIKQPVLVSSADGVGTKLKIAFMTDVHNTVGEDLVNHCVNDILVHGAKPLFFLDYIATGKLSPQVVAEIVAGMSRGCKSAGMALIGGETAEMPDFYTPGEYDLAGFIVGMVDQEVIINGTTIQAGDTCLGLGSNGLHTNGYSLARKVLFEMAGKNPAEQVPQLGGTIAESLMRVHRCYAPLILPLIPNHKIHGMAHITGGGIPGNLSRIIPDGLSANIKRGSWPVPPIFNYIQTVGDLDTDDCYSAFNMGIGFILVVPKSSVAGIEQALTRAGERVFHIGEITSGADKVVMHH